MPDPASLLAPKHPDSHGRLRARAWLYGRKQLSNQAVGHLLWGYLRIVLETNLNRESSQWYAAAAAMERLGMAGNVEALAYTATGAAGSVNGRWPVGLKRPRMASHAASSVMSKGLPSRAA
jgi:hypothetical protein